MQQELYECVGCHEAITNPLCHECLSRDIKVWLNKVAPELTTFFNHFTTNYIEIEGNLICISCNKEMQLCPYCFTEDVYYWIKKIAPELVEGFLLHFNFDLEHKGYSKEEP